MNKVNGYAVILERSATGYGAYSPDIDGCVACGETPEETLQLYTEALTAHLALMREDGDPIPEPTTLVAVVDRADVAA